MTPCDAAAAGLDWWFAVPVLRNPLLVRQAMIIFGLAPLCPLLLIGLAWFPNEDIWLFLRLCLLMYAVACAIGVAALVVSAAFYRRGMGMRFRVTHDGFAVMQDDRRGRLVSGATLALGIATGRPGAIGAGLAASASTDVMGSWSALSGARFHDRLHAIELRNDWRTVAVLYTDAGLYEPVSAYVRAHLTAARLSGRKRRTSPLIKGVAGTAFVIMCSLPLYLLQAELNAGLLPLTIMVAFALATVWLLPVLAAGVAAGAIGCLASFAMSIIARGYMSPDDWVLGSLAAAGLIGLFGLAVAAWRGRFTPVLHGDMESLGTGP